MWTPTVTGTQKIDGKLFVNISISDGVSTVERRRMFAEGTIEDVKGWIDSEVNKLQSVSDINVPIGEVNFELVKSMATASFEPVADTSERDEWIKKLSKFQRIEYLVRIGAWPADSSLYLSLKAEVNAGCKDEYADFI